MTTSSLRESVQRLVNAGLPMLQGSLLHQEYCCQQCKSIIITFILKAFHTNIRIEVRELQGEVRATSLLCLLGIGLGLGSVLLYRIYSRVFPSPLSSLQPSKKQKRPNSSPRNRRPPERAMTHTEVSSAETPDSGISTSTTASLPCNTPIVSSSEDVLVSSGVRCRRPITWKGRAPPSMARSCSMPSYRDVLYEEDFDIEPSLFDGRRYNISTRHHGNYAEAVQCDTNGNTVLETEDPNANVPASDFAHFQRRLLHSTPAVHDQPCTGSPSLKRKVAEFTVGEEEDYAPVRGRRRNFSMCSDASASTSFSYRESLCSKGYSIDLGEALSDFADSELYALDSASCVRTECNMEEIQEELRRIRLEINEMNEVVHDLHTKDDIPNDRYSLGTADVASQDMATWLRKNKSFSRERSVSMDQLAETETESIHEAKMRPNMTYDYMWDYQGDLGGSEQHLSFLANRPIFGKEIVSSGDDSSSLQSPQHLEHVKKYLATEPTEESPVHCSVPHSHTNQSIAGIFIDDDYSALSEQKMPAPRLAIDIQCDPQVTVPVLTCTNCGGPAQSVMDTSFSDSMYSSGIHSYYASESSINTRQSHLSLASSLRSARSMSRSIEEVSKAETLCRIPRWEVSNVEDKKNIYEYAETGLQHLEGEHAVATKKGYHQVCHLLGYSQMRRIRSDNYCALRAVLFQALVNNLPVLQQAGSLQQVLMKLSVFGDPKHSYLRSWTFANRLPYNKDSVAETIAECLKCLYEQVEALSLIHSHALREDYLLAVMNQSPELDLQLMEAVKALMMLQAIDFHDMYTNPQQTSPVFSWLMFSRKTSETPQQLFHSHINCIGDTSTAGPVEMTLLGHTLGLKVEVLRPPQIGRETFISHYPDEGADAFPKIYLVSEDERQFNVVVP